MDSEGDHSIETTLHQSSSSSSFRFSSSSSPSHSSSSSSHPPSPSIKKSPIHHLLLDHHHQQQHPLLSPPPSSDHPINQHHHHHHHPSLDPPHSPPAHDPTSVDLIQSKPTTPNPTTTTTTTTTHLDPHPSPKTSSTTPTNTKSISTPTTTATNTSDTNQIVPPAPSDANLQHQHHPSSLPHSSSPQSPRGTTLAPSTNTPTTVPFHHHHHLLASSSPLIQSKSSSHPHPEHSTNHPTNLNPDHPTSSQTSTIRSFSNPISKTNNQRIYPIKSVVNVKSQSSAPPSQSNPPSASSAIPTSVALLQRPPANQSKTSPQPSSPSSIPKPNSPPPSSPSSKRSFSTPLNNPTSSPRTRPSSNSSNSSTFSSNRSRPNDQLPSIDERPSSHASSSRQSSEKSQFYEKMGAGRARKSSATHFRLPSGDLSPPTQFNPSHNRKSSSTTSLPQAPASMLINLSGLTDLKIDPIGYSTHTSSTHPHLSRPNQFLSESPTLLKQHPWHPSPDSDSSNNLGHLLASHLDPSPSDLFPKPQSNQSDPCPKRAFSCLASNDPRSPQPQSTKTSSSISPSAPTHEPPPTTSRSSYESTPSANHPVFQSISRSTHSHVHSSSSTIPLPSRTVGRDPSSPPTIENPVSVPAIHHNGPSVTHPSNSTLPSQCSSPPTLLSDQDAYLTARFEYKQSDDGLLILTGRKGQVLTCEDEPIRIPGAIQDFGVLIAVLVHGDIRKSPVHHLKFDKNDPSHGILPSPSLDSQLDSDSEEELEEILSITRLEVVQVSENSGHILGLSPKLLLNLYSFTEVLTHEQSQLLCDNLEVCLDSTSTTSAGPHTFRMTGRGGIGTGTDGPSSYAEWSCWCAAHRPDPVSRPRLVVIEFELENDELNPPTTVSVEPFHDEERGGVAGKPYEPTEQDLIESTMSINKPLRALARLRRKGKDFSGDSVEVLSILSQVNNQFDKAEDLPTFLKMAVGVVRELTGFDRVMIYKFDECWNGQVVAELVDWKRTRDLYRGLRFPASDIPAQARELYKINKVRMLYDRDQPTARIMCKSQEELLTPLDMTHCHLRAMSPIHIKYLANMGVRASFSISIIVNDELWGLISCHSYGRFGQRVTFPTRHFCKMLGDTVSRNIHRLHLSQRLQSRKLINTTSTSKNPSGYIVAKAEDLLWLFDAQSGVLSIGEEAKILGNVANSQEILAILEYLRVRCFDSIQVSTDINETFPDIEYPGGFESISGMLVIPLSRGGQDFICFFRPAQMKEIHWAGNPHEKILQDDNKPGTLEPRKSFKIWSETVKAHSKFWTDDQLETGSVLSLVYGKFIDVWRQKEAAVQNNQLQALLLSNASHEVRTPLHQILSTLELALDGQLDDDTRENLSRSYSASRALVHVINDLLDLTKAEQGGDLFSKDPFHLESTLEEAVAIHQREAERKGLTFEMVEDPRGAPAVIQGDRARLRQVVSNLVGNAVKHTTEGIIHVQWGHETESRHENGPEKPLVFEDDVKISIAVTDTGKGIPEAQLENIFRAFEQVGSGESQDVDQCESIGLGLAVVGRVVHNMGGQLRVDSTVNQGSKFTLILPFMVPKSSSLGSTAQGSDDSGNVRLIGSDSTSLPLRGKLVSKLPSSRGSHISHHGSTGTNSSGIDEIVEAIQSGSSCRNSSEAPVSPPVKSRYQLKPKGSHHSVGFNSTGESRDSGSSHSFGAQSSIKASPRSRTSGQRTSAREEKVKTSTQPVKQKEHLLKSHNTEGIGNQSAPVSPLKNIDLARKVKTKPSQAAIVTGKTKPEPTQSCESTDKNTQDEKSQSPKLERPSIKPIDEAGGSTTITPNHPYHNSGLKDVSPSIVEHVSDFQRTRNRTVSKQPMKIMVVEDDPINRLILKKKLTLSGHSVSLTVHGQEAVELFERDPSKFDIILMDLQMPICDGMQATKRVRDFERIQLSGQHTEGESSQLGDDQTGSILPRSHIVNFGVPIIAVSASLHERQRSEILEAGMDGWILKPVDFSRLATLMLGSIDLSTRADLVYKAGTWDKGGWLNLPEKSRRKPKTSNSTGKNVK